MTGRRRLGALLAVVGALLTAIGLIGLLDDGDGTSTEPVATPGTTEPAGDIDGDVRAFVDGLAAAIRAGDADGLYERLHPAVLERYGADRCRSAVAGLQQPDFVLDVVDVGEPEPWDWALEGEAGTTRIEDAVPVQVRRGAGGSTEETEIHVAAVEEDLRWFTDCGDPA